MISWNPNGPEDWEEFKSLHKKGVLMFNFDINTWDWARRQGMSLWASRSKKSIIKRMMTDRDFFWNAYNGGGGIDFFVKGN